MAFEGMCTTGGKCFETMCGNCTRFNLGVEKVGLLPKSVFIKKGINNEFISYNIDGTISFIIPPGIFYVKIDDWYYYCGIDESVPIGPIEELGRTIERVGIHYIITVNVQYIETKETRVFVIKCSDDQSHF